MLVVLCGLSFSGKSTIARELADRLPAEVISFDAMNEVRGLASGHGVALAEWAKTKGAAHARVRDSLAPRRSVVIDDTGSPAFLRDVWRAIAAGAGVEMVLVHVRLAGKTSVRAARQPEPLAPVPMSSTRSSRSIGRASSPRRGAEEALPIDGSDSRSGPAIEALLEQVRSRTG